MKYVVTIADKSYEVEIEDIHARPVIARVDGQDFAVTPEDGSGPAIEKDAKGFKPAPVPAQTVNPTTTSNDLTAPLPGTVIEIFVKAGDHIETGKVILVIEAMKMKNSIRSTRAGTITEVLVSAG